MEMRLKMSGSCLSSRSIFKYAYRVRLGVLEKPKGISATLNKANVSAIRGRDDDGDPFDLDD